MMGCGVSASYPIFFSMEKILIKNMVCRHCVESVRNILEHRLSLPFESVELGVINLSRPLSPSEQQSLASLLQEEGFEIIEKREAEIVERIKRKLIDDIRRDYNPSESLSSRLAPLGTSYATLSRIFSEVEGRSIENYFMNLRIERVKELIKYQQKTLSEIADLTGFSSAAHLSRQFKAFTGLTPSEFKSLGSRRSLADI